MIDRPAKNLTDLPQDESARIIAYLLVQVGLANEIELKGHLQEWRGQGGGDSFEDYLLGSDSFDRQTLEATQTIANLRLASEPQSLYDTIDQWSPDSPKTVQVDHALSLSTDNETPTEYRIPSETSDRFQILTPHQAGGLGEVFKATDQQFGREVALKKIKASHLNDQKIRNRFLMEAEITGGLEHPGIVPVYGMGVDGNQSPFYAMKFIKGKTLHEEITAFHQSEPDYNSLEFRRLLQRFTSVCYTMHFSHSRGVIHRDIKPDNIMLGDFDETLVVDWGIAKIIGTQKNPKASEELTSDTLPSVQKNVGDNTQLGQLVGTPGYMSGEQALGWHDSLGPDSDIFSLGATLYTLLTNQRPFDAPSLQDCIQNTVTGELVRPREHQSRLPRSLEAICLKAMNHTRSHRYETAKKLAEDLEAYLADEPIRGWREPWTIRSRRWLRKNRTLVMAATTMLVLLTIGSVIASLLLASSNRREIAARTEADRNFETANLALQRETKARSRADASFLVAKKTIDDVVNALASDPRFDGESMQGLREEFLNNAESLYVELEEQHPQSLALERAYSAVQIAQLAESLGDSQKNLVYLEKAESIAEPLVDTEASIFESHVQEFFCDIMLKKSQGYRNLGENQKSFAYVKRGLEVARAHGEAIPELLDEKLWLLVQSEHLLSSEKKVQELYQVRAEYWKDAQRFSQLKTRFGESEQVSIFADIASKVPLSQAEGEKYRTFRREVIVSLETIARNMDAGQLRQKALQAKSLDSVAVGYASFGEYKRAFEVGLEAVAAWNALAESNRSIVNYQSQLIRSTYYALTARTNWEAHQVHVKRTDAERMDSSELISIYQQAERSYAPFQTGAATNVDTSMLFAMLSSTVGNYLSEQGQQLDRVNKMFDQAIQIVEAGLAESAIKEKVANTVLRNAVIHFNRNQNFDRADAIQIKQMAFARKTASESPEHFDSQANLYRLRISRSIQLLNRGKAKEALQNSVESLAELRTVPKAEIERQIQKWSGFMARQSAMAGILAEKLNQPQKGMEFYQAGIDELVSHSVKLENAESLAYVVELCRIYSFKKIAAKEYSDAQRAIDYLLEFVKVPANVRVKMLADRAKCHAKLGKTVAALSDFRAGNSQAGGMADDVQLDLMIAALMIAENLEKLGDERGDELKDETPANFEDYAATMLKQKWDQKKFEFEIVRQMLRPIKELDRLKERAELKELFESLPKKGKPVPRN